MQVGRGDDPVERAADHFAAVRVRTAGQNLGLSPAEQIAITLFTAEDYKYINPATANNKDWMLSQRPDHVRSKHAKMDENARPTAEKEWMKRRLEEGSLHAAFAVSGMATMPVFGGTTYRGEIFTAEEFCAKFNVTKRGASPRARR